MELHTFPVKSYWSNYLILRSSWAFLFSIYSKFTIFSDNKRRKQVRLLFLLTFRHMNVKGITNFMFLCIDCDNNIFLSPDVKLFLSINMSTSLSQANLYCTTIDVFIWPTSGQRHQIPYLMSCAFNSRSAIELSSSNI